MMRVESRTDLDPCLLIEALMAAHPSWRGTPDPLGWRDPLVRVEWDPETDEVTIEHPDADLSPIIAATRGKSRPPDPREQARARLKAYSQKPSPTLPADDKQALKDVAFLLGAP